MKFESQGVLTGLVFIHIYCREPGQNVIAESQRPNVNETRGDQGLTTVSSFSASLTSTAILSTL